MAIRVESTAGARSTGSTGASPRWVTTTDHKRIGILYIVTSLVFFGAGGILALLMRAQLATPNEHFVTADTYNQLFTIHGTTMVFLVVVPILAGFGNYLVPLMIGARDMAFPRLNALSYWLFLFGGDRPLHAASWPRAAPRPAAGRCYPPLSEKEFSPGNGVDLWILSLHLLSIASLIGAINFVVTIANMRAAGMTWMRMPLFVWSMHDLRRSMLILVLPVALGRADAPAARPSLRRLALLQAGPGRQRPALAERLLVLRAPRGLHHDPAGDGDRLRDHPRLLAQADLRLQGDRLLDDRHRLRLDARLGPPPVHGRLRVRG